MRADMRSIVTFQSPPTGVDEYGAPNITWSDTFKNVFASVEPLIGNEYYTANAMQTKAEVKIRTYYFDGVTNLMRIKHGDTYYKILSAVNVKSLNRELLCYCEKVV